MSDDTKTPLDDILAAHRDVVLEEAAALIDAAGSPFHSSRSTDMFWESQRFLAKLIRNTKGNQ